jgi:crossover junction endodeoxyribonuclease RusA
MGVMDKIEFIIPVKPVAWQRVKRGKYGQSYVPKKTKEFEDTVGYFAMSAARGLKFGPGPLILTAKFILERPKTSKNLHPCIRPDLDNYLKALKDGLNGVLFQDDSQVVQYGPGTGKYYDMSGGRARIEVSLESLS